MTDTLLCTHPTADTVVAYRQGEPVSRSRFLADARQLMQRFPAGGFVLNACSDRYHFAIGFVAALMSGRVSLLPSTHTPAMVEQMRLLAPDVFCLADGPVDIDLPTVRCPALSPVEADVPVPAIADSQIAAVVFTSGSTGTPQPHRKTWGSLARSAQAEGERLRCYGDSRLNIVGTVPPQHMYGFESTILLPLQTGGTLCSERPFYPADIAAVLAQVPCPRMLVTSPVHLRALLASADILPQADLILSATAPLDRTRAMEAEARLGGPLVEIYGATETGQIASRRTCLSELWETLPGMHLKAEPGRVCIDGGPLAGALPLGDRVELRDTTHFLLLGRGEDIVNIAGKRTSLAFLEHELQGIPGVLDAAFWVPEEDSGAVTRLAAFAVAPGLSAPELLERLRACIDPAFLPRPLLLVDALPRNATGKLPRAALEALRATAVIAAPHTPTWVFPGTHPAFAGHFPGHPVVPGVLLLEAVVTTLDVARPDDTHPRFEGVKFLSPVAPDECVALSHNRLAPDRLEFKLRVGERPVASGQLRWISGEKGA